ncbi:MAG: S-methyl-5-thioribose-1-phosphate isomerase [Firmicutes bacterium]|nr:S-methyl-5-thioribose-1-phosphate isomerase [Bacillota bacterium]
MRPLIWQGRALKLLDQRALPEKESYITCHTLEEVQKCIREMAVRGAPAIGVASAFALVLAAQKYIHDLNAKDGLKNGFSPSGLQNYLTLSGDALRATRPTAVNLSWAVERMLKKCRDLGAVSPETMLTAFEREAIHIFEEDLAANKKIGSFGAKLFAPNSNVLTHCNAGALATAGYGTALGVLRSAFRAGTIKHVYACETRPFLQGSRLTAWELQKEGIPFSIIVDSAAGYFMYKQEIRSVIVGADRVAANGDIANKIGTYALAVLAQANKLPFYVAAPFSSIDLSISSGEEIAVEERAPEEITTYKGTPLSPPGAQAKNPAFDITPANLITVLITEHGILPFPREKQLRRFVQQRGRKLG